MKKYVFLVILILFSCITVSEANAKTTINQKDFYDSYITLLDPYASEAITKKFGMERSYDLFDVEIISIERINKGRNKKEKIINDGMFDFIIKAQYNTFEGAHNPPNKSIIITFQVIPGKTKVINIEGTSE